jgi:hypothetical protein
MHMRKLILSGLVGLTFATSVHAADISLSAEEQNNTVVTQTGKRRALENLKIVDQNIDDTKYNLNATKRNAETIQAELKQLSELEKEHLEMLAKYKAYTEEAKPKIAANIKELKELETIEKKMGKKGTEEIPSPELERLQREKLERLKWDSEAKLKLSQISKMQSEAERNLKDINSRFKPLQAQLRTWNERQKEFEELLAKYGKRRATLERQIGSAVSPPNDSSNPSGDRKDTNSRIPAGGNRGNQ